MAKVKKQITRKEAEVRAWYKGEIVIMKMESYQKITEKTAKRFAEKANATFLEIINVTEITEIYEMDLHEFLAVAKLVKKFDSHKEEEITEEG